MVGAGPRVGERKGIWDGVCRGGFGELRVTRAAVELAECRPLRPCGVEGDAHHHNVRSSFKTIFTARKPQYYEVQSYSFLELR